MVIIPENNHDCIIIHPKAKPTPTPTPTISLTRSPTPSITSSVTAQPTATPTNTKTPTPTNTRTASQTPTPTNTRTATQTPTKTPSQTPTTTITTTPTVSLSATISSTPTRTVTPTKTVKPTQTPTRTATPTKTYVSTPTPTRTPTATCIPSVPTLRAYVSPDGDYYGPGSPNGTGATFSLTYSPATEQDWPYGATFPSWKVSNVTVTNGGSGYVYGSPLLFELGVGDVPAGRYNWIFMRTNRLTPTLTLGVNSDTGSGSVLSANLTFMPETNHWVGDLWTISSINISNGGTGYAVNDTLSLNLNDSSSSPYGWPFSATVSAIDSNGGITSIAIQHGGNYYKEGGVIQGIQNPNWFTAFYRKMCCPPTNSECVSVSCSRDWDYNDCIEATIKPCYVDDGKLPVSNPEEVTLKIPSKIYIENYLYQYNQSSNSWVRGSDSLSIVDGRYNFTYNGQSYVQNPSVRYRQIYSDYTLDENGSCNCSVASYPPCGAFTPNTSLSYVEIEGGEYFWGNGGLQPFAGNPNDNALIGIGLIVCGPFNQCGTTMTDSLFTRPAIAAWLNNGGILCIKSDIDLNFCENHAAINQYLANIGSTMSISDQIGCDGAWGQPITFNHYVNSSLAISCGLPSAIGSTGNSASIAGGIPITTVKPCVGRPAGVSLAGQQIGNGAILLVGDGNMAPLQNLTSNIINRKLQNLPIFDNIDRPCFKITYGAASCRIPVMIPDCSWGDTSGAVDHTTLPHYPNYIDGCMGRPIDIDYGVCDSTIKPTSFDRPNFVLYYNGDYNKPLLVVDNVVYDTRNSPLVRVFTASSPAALRQMVCTRLRFATILDENKLNPNNINCGALTSNWPFNDLYWYSYNNMPDEVSINCVPC